MQKLASDFTAVLTPQLKSFRLYSPAVAEGEDWGAVFMPQFAPELAKATALTSLELQSGDPELMLSASLVYSLAPLTSLQVRCSSCAVATCEHGLLSLLQLCATSTMHSSRVCSSIVCLLCNSSVES